MKTLPYLMVLVLAISGCASEKRKTSQDEAHEAKMRNQMYADAIAQPEFIAERAKAQAEAQAREDARAERQAVIDAEKKIKQAVIDAEKKIKEDERHKAAEVQRQADKEALEKMLAARHAERKKTEPKCLDIRFSGVASAPLKSHFIERVLASHDIEDTIARNPLMCERTYGCSRGFAYFSNKNARITDWDKEFFSVLTTLDLTTGRIDAVIYIRRKDARCSK